MLQIRKVKPEGAQPASGPTHLLGVLMLFPVFGVIKVSFVMLTR